MTREEREDSIDIIQSILDKYEEDECLAAEITIGDEDIEALKIAIKALEQESEDAISRAETVQFLTNHSNDFEDVKIRMAFRVASSLVNNPHNLPSVQPKYNTDEWCHDCSEYDHNKHCCPRFNKVIRNTVEKVKQQKIKTGHWIPKTKYWWECSECGRMIYAQTESDKLKFHAFCGRCGAKMVEPQAESEK